MSLKPVELQIALPRTVDNSRNQQIQQNQAALQNAIDGEQLTRDTTVTEQTVLDTEDSARAELRERKQSQDGAQRERGNKHDSQASDAVSEAPHPYKGQRLDIRM
ncbi:hypothetical protein [Tumebacillus permanentifrigoris]|uniref:Uncharacterized protein n=1 Tax=Tumebacillus permanentifrigoris TaxID=378543 RepID=A0A316D9A7_9BACL|nr:hypothetical protein [Tumebacillus permanentifrigoris]PWK12684.1 hypothetical protein C7459_10936 [Tumebacillus permanentifrigoris]